MLFVISDNYNSITLMKPSMNMYIQCDFMEDEVAEWLRRWTANPLGSARVGSNPILVAVFFSGEALQCDTDDDQ